jgi:hypothetical protein
MTLEEPHVIIPTAPPSKDMEGEHTTASSSYFSDILFIQGIVEGATISNDEPTVLEEEPPSATHVDAGTSAAMCGVTMKPGNVIQLNPSPRIVTPHPILGPALLTPGSSLGLYNVPTDQHESFMRTLSSLIRTRENFLVGHPSQIAPSQARLTWRFFPDRLPKTKMHLVGMDTLLILLSLGSGYHHPRG